MSSPSTNGVRVGRRPNVGSAVLESFPDEVLVEEVRHGNADAGLVLWRRHVEDCRASVSSVLDDIRAVDHSIRRTFGRVLQEIRDDADPLATFGVYLRTTVLLDACLGSVSAAAAPIVRAFSDLSRLDQLLLWASLIDQAPRVELALLGSITPDEVPGRVHAAAARLRAGWLMRLSEASRAESACPWEVLGALNARSRRHGPGGGTQWQRHQDECSSCQRIAAENERFPSNLLDALLRLPRAANLLHDLSSSQ